MREDQADQMIKELKWISWGLVKVPLLCGAISLIVILSIECGKTLGGDGEEYGPYPAGDDEYPAESEFPVEE